MAPNARVSPAAAGSTDDPAALIARCRNGDASAWAELVRRYQRLVHAIVRRVGLDEHAAADVFQSVFARLLSHLPRLAQPERVQAWIVTTAKREALLMRRRGQRTQSMSSDDDNPALDIADDAALPDEVLQDLQQLAELRHALERLDERCRALLALVFRDDHNRLGYDEVAKQLQMPVGSIGPTRSRCLDKLRKLWRESAL